MDENPLLHSAKLGKQGQVNIPRPLLHTLNLDDKTATLYFLLRERRIVILTEEEMMERVADV